jgi:hypothetical protein
MSLYFLITAGVLFWKSILELRRAEATTAYEKSGE